MAALSLTTGVHTPLLSRSSLCSPSTPLYALISLMDAFSTLFSAATQLSSATTATAQPASSAVEELPQIDTVEHDRNTGSSGSCIIA
ncbi:hypothetical protein B0H10DRAFT_2218941 [Mycena sp. CBHHK59/15]|nr:hypothetical protein B0H10DRAFT_2218941 [Mycena sp. CBHHK59/15]